MRSANTLLLFAGSASATFFPWIAAPTFITPTNNNNSCDGQQQQGYSWAGLQTGSFSSYDGFAFSGFQCSNSFGKRDPLSKRTFGGKVISGLLAAGSGPSVSCSAGKDFSIKEYQVSVSKDVDVEFHYQMDDGSTCQHTSSCKTGGTVVQNSQCGGAKQVSFQLPIGAASGCQIGIHSIGFDCSPPASASPPKAPSSSIAISSPPFTPAIPTGASVPSSSAPASLPLSSKPGVPFVSAPSASPSVAFPTLVPNVSYASMPSVLPSSILSIASSMIPKIVSSYSMPAISLPSSSPVVPALPTPSSITVASASTPVSPVSSSVLSLPVPALPSSAAPMPPQAPAPCPNVLPQCLNTWMHQTGCKDNSDYSCYCKQADYTDQVMQCVSSYGADALEVQKALSYLIGICADYVPQNPGLITNCPPEVPLTGASVPSASSVMPTPAVGTAPAAQLPPVMLTTVVVMTSVTTCPVGQTVSQAGVTTILPTPSVSTVYVTSTSTFCPKCSASPALSTPVAPKPSAASAPMTTITIAQTYSVPCTYSTGVSAGFPMPSSSTITTLSTAVTVPQVAFTTAAPVSGSTPAVGLVPAPTPAPPASQKPSQAAASSMPMAASSGVPLITTGIMTASRTGFGTTYVPSATSSGIVMQTVNAAPRLGSGPIGGLFAGGLMAFFAL